MADTRRRTATLLRVLIAICVVVSAVVHLDLWQDGMKTLDVVGPAFLLNGVGGLVLGVLVLVWRHWLPLLGAVGFGVATLTAFLISTTPGGFFGVHEQWVGWAAWAVGDLGDRRDRPRHRGTAGGARPSRGRRPGDLTSVRRGPGSTP